MYNMSAFALNCQSRKQVFIADQHNTNSILKQVNLKTARMQGVAVQVYYC